MEHGLNLLAIIAIGGSVLLWSFVSPRLERWNISGPMFFVAAGLLLANEPISFVHLELHSETLRSLAEVTLAIVLFGDAAAVRGRELRGDAALPGRLLGLGLPLTMAAGTVTAKLLFPDLSWWVCAVIGTAVAPTDAALGAAIIEDRRMPVRIRRVLNVESGLNDGIVTPFVNFFLIAAVSGTALQSSSLGAAIADLALGVMYGIAIGAAGGWLLAHSGATSNAASRNLGALSLGLLAYAATVELGANGFVAAFMAGLAYGIVERRTTAGSADATSGSAEETLGLTHQSAELLSFVVWFFFGAVMVPLLADAGWQDIAFALLALTLLRMAPVVLSLLGAGLDGASVAVVGWFGPRGLASVVFALLALDRLAPADGDRVLIAITTVVAMSVLLHGASAAPIAARFSATHSDPVPIDDAASVTA